METSQMFGTEKISKVLLKMAPPVMLAQLIQALYNIVDSLFIGRYAESGLTALSIIYPIQLLMIALAVGTGVGINTVMAARLGTGQKEEADEYAGVGTPLAIAMWFVFALVCWLIMPGCPPAPKPLFKMWSPMDASCAYRISLRYGRRYDPDRMSAYEAPQKRQEMGHADGYEDGEHLTREQAEKRVRGMKSEDGKTGARWPYEEIKRYAANFGIQGEDQVVEFFAVMNALYSDYCKVAKKYGVDKTDFWADMAKAFIHDKDVKSGKVKMYYECIAEHDED